jgi:hypothetical protein
MVRKTGILPNLSRDFRVCRIREYDVLMGPVPREPSLRGLCSFHFLRFATEGRADKSQDDEKPCCSKRAHSHPPGAVERIYLE